MPKTTRVLLPLVVALLLPPSLTLLDYKSLFFQNVEVSVVIDYDDDLAASLVIRSNGLPNHHYDEKYEASELTMTIPITNRGAVYEDPIGVALNGVPMYSTVAGEADDCFGYSIDGRYAYHIAPPCMYNDGVYKSIEEAAYSGFGSIHEDNFRENRAVPRIVAIMRDGYPLYSPLDETGRPWNRSRLDACGGRIYNGDYAYFATLEPPYTAGCFRHDTVVEAQCRPGYYKSHGDIKLCPRGSFCRGDCAAIPCDAGKYGPTEGLASCDAYVAPPGFFAVQGSIRPSPCGSPAYYCPAGSASRTPVSAGYYSFSGSADQRSAQAPCERGTFCVAGVKTACPPGRSTSVASTKCLHRAPPGKYAPEGSTTFHPLPAGRYSPEWGLGSPMEAEIAPRGFFTTEGATEATPCPPGTFASVEGTTKDCDLCPPGFACPPGGTATPLRCDSPAAETALRTFLTDEDATIYATGLGRSVYCPAGTALPLEVPLGFYNIDDSKDIRECEAGSYCRDGIKSKCPAGRYGSTSGLSSILCSGLCAPGHVCPEGSTTSIQQVCGSSEWYCPEGFNRLPVGPGNYSVAFLGDQDETVATSSNDRRSAQKICEPGFFCLDGVRRPCPAGKYGAAWGLTSCSNAPPGMYTIEGSTEARPVDAGYYCTGSCGTAQGDGRCAPGFYCPRGSASRMQRPCCDARIDGVTGLAVKYERDDSDLAVDLISLVTEDNELPPGKVFDHGDWHRHDAYATRCDRVYCPEGSSAPVPVDNGYYAVGGNRTTHSAQRSCLTKDEDLLRPLLLGGTRREAYCPTTSSSETAFESSVALNARPEFGAWATPRYLGLWDSPYRWEDDSYNDDVLLWKQEARLRSSEPYFYDSSS